MLQRNRSRKAKNAPLGAIIVGAGLMGRWHAHALRKCGISVAAIVDSQAERAERLAAKFRGTLAVTELEEAMALIEVDAVHICTPTQSHLPLTEIAIKRGYHVLVEKPLASTVADTNRLLEQADLQEVLLCPVLQFPFQDGVFRAKNRLPAIGRLSSIAYTARSSGGEGLDSQARRRLVTEILPHAFSLYKTFLPHSLCALNWHILHPAAGELRAQCRAGATTVSLEISLSGRPPVNELEIVGQFGTIYLDLFHGYSFNQPGTVSRLRKATHPFELASRRFAAATPNLGRRLLSREFAYPGLRQLISHFYRAITQQTEAPIPADEIREIAALRDRFLEDIYDSGR